MFIDRREMKLQIIIALTSFIFAGGYVSYDLSVEVSLDAYLSGGGYSYSYNSPDIEYDEGAITLGFELVVIDILNNKHTKEKFSSSYIRDLITKGDFNIVSQMLGRNWSLFGKVIRGDQKARKINFPTANIKPEDKILPKKGVYCVKASIDSKTYKAVANFGYRPTVNGSVLLLETHLFDFNDDIYGKELTVEFLAFIRAEKKFDNFQELTKQIQKDIKTAKIYHQI